MKIIVLNHVPNIPELPYASEVKLCQSPLEIIGNGNNPKLYASRSSEITAISSLIKQATDKEVGENIYFVEMTRFLPREMTVEIGIINPTTRAIFGPLVTAKKGELFGGKSGWEIRLSSLEMTAFQDLDRLQEMVEIARFLLHEVK